MIFNHLIVKTSELWKEGVFFFLHMPVCLFDERAFFFFFKCENATIPYLIANAKFLNQIITVLTASSTEKSHLVTWGCLTLLVC